MVGEAAMAVTACQDGNRKVCPSMAYQSPQRKTTRADPGAQHSMEGKVASPVVFSAMRRIFVNQTAESP